MLTFTPAENLQPKVNLTCMSLDCRKKLRCPKRTYTDTRRTYKLQIKLSVGIFEPRLSILWANRKNPVYCFCDIENSTYLVNPLPFIVHPAELNKNICTYWKKELRYLRKQKFLFKKKKKRKDRKIRLQMGPGVFYPLCVVVVTCDRCTLFIDLAWGLNQAAGAKGHSRPDTGEGRQTSNMSASHHKHWLHIDRRFQPTVNRFHNKHMGFLSSSF